MIALLLGSFNPIHNGHIAIARHALDKGLADEVWFVVSPQNPLKSAYELAPYEDRIKMARLAIAGHEKMQVCDIESTLPYPSYTINTLRELHKTYPNEQFIILAGSDIPDQLHLWREHEEVQRLARFVIYPRGKRKDNCSPEMADAPLIEISSTECRSGLYTSTEMADAPLIEISSTECRSGLYTSTEIASKMPPEVLKYIHKKQLYTMKTIHDYDTQIAGEPKNEELYFERGQLHYRSGNFGKALNDFNDTLAINHDHSRARQMRTMIEEILAFRHTDTYNP